MDPDGRANEGSVERVPCIACGDPTPPPEEVNSPVCYRPLCEDCSEPPV